MKVLAMVNGQSLAHVTRPLEVAKILRQTGCETIFAGAGKYLEIARNEGFAVEELPFISVPDMVEAVRTGRLDRLYPEVNLVTYLEAEKQIIAKHQPQLILNDCRVTAVTSAELAGLPCVSIANTHMTLNRKIPFSSIREILPWLPHRLIQVMDSIQNKIEFFFYEKFVLGALARLRKKLGLRRLHSNAMETGDRVCMADIPEFNPAENISGNILRSASGNTQFVGPITWKNTMPAPSWLDRLDRSKKVVYLSLGSEGLNTVLDNLESLLPSEVQFIVVTGQTQEASRHLLTSNQKIPANVFIEPFVNAELVLPHCDLVICHGGNGTIYQALGFGLPVAGFATHREQFHGLRRLQELGLGKAFWLKDLEREGAIVIKNLVEDILGDPQYRIRACGFQPLIHRSRGAEVVAAEIQKLLGLSQSHQPKVRDGETTL